MLLRNRISVTFLLTLGLVSGVAHAQVTSATDAEPNNACAAAQNLSTAAIPVTVQGQIGVSDIDYYRFTATPGSVISIDHQQSGAQPLGDPLMAVYSSDCSTLLAIDDYSGGYVNARVTLTVPADGSFVVAATAYPDYELTGSTWYQGTYTLSLQKVALAEGIVGRIVDARSGAPLDGFVSLTYAPDPYRSEGVGYAFTGASGEFRFEQGSYSIFNLLRAGRYEIRVVVSNYEEIPAMVVEVAEGELLNLGDLALTPLPTVGSIRGRAVDSLTGAPLPGTAAPFSQALLLSCEPMYSPYCGFQRYGSVDAQGYFQFASTDDNPIRPGTYEVLIYGDQYKEGKSARFTVADQQHLDIGNVRLQSFPVRVNLTQSCGPVPTAGGTCGFTVKVSNGMPARLHGEAWSLVQANGLASAVAGTTFQTDKPQVLNLAPGGSVNLPFSFFVPGEVRDGTYICVETFASQRPHLFNTLGYNDVFCMRKGSDGFVLVPERQKRDAVKAAKGETVLQP